MARCTFQPPVFHPAVSMSLGASLLVTVECTFVACSSVAHYSIQMQSPSTVGFVCVCAYMCVCVCVCGCVSK